MNASPAKCRSRIRALRSWIAAAPPDKPGEKGSDKKLLLYGVVPESHDLQAWLAEDIDAEDTEPLDVVETMTLDTWFYQHPEKVCGKEVLTSSREFPLTIKGTREDCESVFEKHFGPLAPSSNDLRSSTKDAEALAAIALLAMLEMELAIVT